MSFRIRIEPAGVEFRAGPGERLLEAAARQGVALAYGCRDGSCGSCRMLLRAGRIAYPDPDLPALGPPVHGAQSVLTCQARAGSDLVLEGRTVQDAPAAVARSAPARIERLERASAQVMRVWLRLPPGIELGQVAGQYLEVLLGEGRRRAYSIASAPRPGAALELHVARLGGGLFSERIFARARAGHALRVHGPFGQFRLHRGPRPLLLVAGGTGFAPIKALLEDAFAHGLQRPAHLYWGVRHAGELYLATLVRGWARERPGFGFSAVYSHEAADGERHGLVHAAVLEDVPDLGAYDIYVSGPPALVAAARASFPAQGADPERLFSDSFEMARR